MPKAIPARRGCPRQRAGHVTRRSSGNFGGAHAAAQTKEGAVTCASCHGTHDTLKKTNPKSSVYPKRQPATCARCHNDSNVQTRLPPERLSGQRALAGHGEGRLDRLGDLHELSRKSRHAGQGEPRVQGCPRQRSGHLWQMPRRHHREVLHRRARAGSQEGQLRHSDLYRLSRRPRHSRSRRSEVQRVRDDRQQDDLSAVPQGGVHQPQVRARYGPGRKLREDLPRLGGQVR